MTLTYLDGLIFFTDGLCKAARNDNADDLQGESNDTRVPQGGMLVST